MKTTIVDGKEVPLVTPTKVTTTIKNKHTEEIYKTEEEWKTKGIPESEIRKDVRIIMPSLDLFGETK